MRIKHLKTFTTEQFVEEPLYWHSYEIAVKGLNQVVSGTLPTKRFLSAVNARPYSFTRNLPPPGSRVRKEERNPASGPKAGG
jgi:hypothetical protein